MGKLLALIGATLIIIIVNSWHMISTYIIFEGDNQKIPTMIMFIFLHILSIVFTHRILIIWDRIIPEINTLMLNLFS